MVGRLGDGSLAGQDRPGQLAAAGQLDRFARFGRNRCQA